MKLAVKGLHSYYIDGKAITKIIFYKDGEVVGQTNRAFLEAMTSRKETETPLEFGEHRISTIDEVYGAARANKINLNRDDIYTIKLGKSYGVVEYALYIPSDLFPSFTPRAERVASQYNGHINYANYYSFTFHADGVEKTCEIQESPYTRTVEDNEGAKARKIQELMNANGFRDFSYNSAMTLANDPKLVQNLLAIVEG